MLHLHVTNTATYVEGETDDEFRKLLRQTVGFLDDRSEYRAELYPGYDGMISTLCYGYGPKPCKCSVQKQGMHFPSGLLGRVIRFLGERGVPFDIKDHRVAVDKITSYSVSAEMETRDYQIQVVNDAIRIGRGIIKMSTGSGKTSVAARLIASLGAFPFIFFVPTKDLLKQAQDEFARFLRKDGQPVKIGAVGGGHRDIQDITVMTIQTARMSLDHEAYDTAKRRTEQQAVISARRALIAQEKAERKAERDRQRKAKEDEKARLQADRIAGGMRPLKKFAPTIYKDIPETAEVDAQYDALEPQTDEDEDLDGTEDFEDLGDFRRAVRDLIHNCKGFCADEVQFWSSKTCQLIADHAYSAKYRYGLSATPKRDQGDDMLIDACFGKAICDINASFLIDRGFLVQPTIYFVPIRTHRGIHFESYAEAYSEAIVENEKRNEHICNIAQKMKANGRNVLILVKHIHHGELLNKRIADSVFVYGSHSSALREQHIAAMREHRAPITVASTIFDQGVDVKPLDCVIMAGGGKSPCRALQRIGRAIRPYSFGDFVKKDAIIIDFEDQCKWFREHSCRRRMIYSTEPRFVIKDLKLS